eukprot:Clim_evm7s78 gene=Clim_evmTU7s78
MKTLFLAGLLLVLAAVAIRRLWAKFFPERIYNAALKIPGYKPTNYWIGNTDIIPKEGYKMYDWETHMQEKFGDVTVQFLGPLPMFQIHSAKAAETVFKSYQFLEKNFIYKVIKPWLGPGLLIAGGSKWHGRRRQLTPAFHFDILKEYFPIFQEQAMIFRNKLAKRGCVEGKVIDIFHEGTLATLDIINEAAMGTKIEAQSFPDSEYVQAVLRMSEIATDRIVSPLSLVSDAYYYNCTSLGQEELRTLKMLHDFTDKTINTRRAIFHDMDPEEYKNRKRMVFLDLLLKLQQDCPEGMTDVDMRNEVDTFMFEGHDTTAAGIGWTFYELGRHPEIQQKLQQELDAVLGDKDVPDFDDIKKLEYLNMVVKEALRVHPSVSAIGREAGEDLMVEGHLIPKGATIQLILHNMCVHKDDFVDPLTFDPERWAAHPPKKYLEKKPHPMAAIAFSAGPRNCIGQKFATYEEKVLIATVLKSLNLETVKDTTPRAELITRPFDGVLVKLTPRVHEGAINEMADSFAAA